DERPRSASARPSAICFWRDSMARTSGGQMNFTQNQMNAAKVIACAISVRLKFMLRPFRGLSDLREQRVGEREEHREADADDERRVDQAEQQENLGLQLRH